MLRELGPEDPTVEGRVLIIGAIFFIICGLNFKRIADYSQRRTGHSDKVKAAGIIVMRPLLFILAAMGLVFAYMFLSGRA
jgi:hypothetical protein